MKTIGLIGGMSWESTVTYYRIINETVKKKLGGLHSARILMYSVDFEEIERCMSAGNWDRCAVILTDAAKRLETAGADFILVCTNTLHKVAPEIGRHLSVPLLHIAEVTAGRLKEAGVSTVGLLGTGFTMTQSFYSDVLAGHGIHVIIPEGEGIRTVNDIIFNELCVGIIKEESRKAFLRIMEELHARGAQGIVLGCTELGLLIRQEDSALPMFDTAVIHAEEAALAALAGCEAEKNAEA